MSDFSDLMTDRVTIEKSSGERFENQPASVQGNRIFMDYENILIEPGDRLTRKMSNGAQETFEVIDPGFHEEFHGIAAGYQMEVRKLGIRDRSAPAPVVNYNVSGSNARINIHSVDNSVNTVNISTSTQILNEMRREIESAVLDPQQRESAFEVLNAIEHQCDGGKPSHPVLNALLQGLPQMVTLAEYGKRLIEIFWPKG